MRKISQGVATKIATDMVAKTIGRKLKEENIALQNKKEEIATKSVNKEVFAFNVKFPGYIKFNSYIRCACGELHLGDMNVKSFPSNKSSYYDVVEISREDYDWFTKQLALIEVLEGEKSKLESQIYKTLLHLSTPKRIQSDFPEAYELLEVIIKEEENQKCVVVALPIDEIKNSLLKYKD